MTRQGDLSWSARRTDLLVVTLATMLAAGLSLLFLGDRSLWIDEGSSIYFARDAASMWQKLAHREANMWFYYLLLNLWLRLGDSEAIVRGLSALCATAAIPLIYVLGRRLFGSRAGAIASLLLASNSYFIRYAQEARGYTLLVLLAALSSYFFVRAVDEDARGGWVGHGVATGLAIYTHFFAALVYLAQMITAALAGKMAWRWRGLALSTAIIAAFLVPIPLFQPLAHGQIEWVQPLTAQHLFRFFLQIIGGSRALLLLYLVFWVLALASAARKPAESTSSRERWRYLFVSAWILVPVAVATVFSLLVKPVFVDRYLIGSLGAMVLLAGAGIARLQPRWLCVPVLLLFLYGSARCLDRWYSRNAGDDWRSTTAYVLSQAHPGDGAVFYVPAGKRCFDYYRGRLGGSASPTTLELALETEVDQKPDIQAGLQPLSSLPAAYERVWLFLNHDLGHPGPSDQADRAALLNHLDGNYVLQWERDFADIKVRLYQRSTAWDPSRTLNEGAR